MFPKLYEIHVQSTAPSHNDNQIRLDNTPFSSGEVGEAYTHLTGKFPQGHSF